MDWAGSRFSDGDASEWNLSSVKTITTQGLQASDGSKAQGLTGTLKLPSLETLGTKAILNWKRLTGITLGTKGTLSSVSSYALYGASSLESIDFGTNSTFTTEATSFLLKENTALPLKAVYFESKAPDRTTLDNVLALQPATGLTANSVKVYAPLWKWNWHSLTSSMTDGEKSIADTMKASGEDVRGVYVNANGDRVAWLVEHPAIEWHSGLIIIFR